MASSSPFVSLFQFCLLSPQRLESGERVGPEPLEKKPAKVISIARPNPYRN
jgi:hypothetical protein